MARGSFVRCIVKIFINDVIEQTQLKWIETRCSNSDLFSEPLAVARSSEDFIVYCVRDYCFLELRSFK